MKEIKLKIDDDCGDIEVIQEGDIIHITRREEKLYRAGDRFLYSNTECVLAQVAPKEYKLISIKDGNRLSDKVLRKDHSGCAGFTLSEIQSTVYDTIIPVDWCH